MNLEEWKKLLLEKYSNHYLPNKIVDDWEEDRQQLLNKIEGLKNQIESLNKDIENERIEHCDYVCGLMMERR